MKVKQFLQLMNLLMFMQSGVLMTASAGMARVSRVPKYNASSWRSSLRSGSNRSGLEYAMNPQYNPYNQQVNTSTKAMLNPSILNEIVVAPSEKFMVPYVSMKSSLMPFQDNWRIMKMFKNDLLDKLNQIDETREYVLPQQYHRNKIAFLKSKQKDLNTFANGLELEDFQSQRSVENMKEFIAAVLEFEVIKLRESLRNYQPKEFDEEDFNYGMPVENPYEEVKSDVKGQFYRGAKFGAVGAGALYGLKKYQEANDIK